MLRGPGTSFLLSLARCHEAALRVAAVDGVAHGSRREQVRRCVWQPMKALRMAAVSNHPLAPTNLKTIYILNKISQRNNMLSQNKIFCDGAKLIF